jgi:hypothetical protein
MFNLNLTAEYLGFFPDNMFHWTVTLRRDGRQPLTTCYLMCAAHCRKVKHHQYAADDTAEVVDGNYVIPNRPVLRDVLESLQLDARAGEHMLFEDFCDEFGYDSDSRSAHKIWRDCQETRGRLQRLLGADFDAFMSTNFDNDDQEQE